jgi:rsbT co-antagonist protein RsbR
MAVGTLQTAEMSVLQEMDLTDQEISRRKEFLEFGDEDVKTLKGLNDLAQKYAESVIEDFYKHFLSFEETRAFFQDPATLIRVKQLQKEYFLGLTQGSYGADYIANRLKVGLVHQRIKLDVKWYLGAYNFYLRAVMSRLFESFEKSPAKAIAGFRSMMKLVFLDISLAIQTYVRTIQQQQEAIRELSTPVLQLRPRLLMLPIVGVIDSQRAKQLTDSLLRAIRANRAKVVVMDITGVGAVDSKVANHLIQTVAAARLMGTTVIITGLSGEVAQALVTLGVDLTKLNTVGDLQGGLEEAERMLGLQVVALKDLPGGSAPA